MPTANQGGKIHQSLISAEYLYIVIAEIEYKQSNSTAVDVRVEANQSRTSTACAFFIANA